MLLRSIATNGCGVTTASKPFGLAVRVRIGSSVAEVGSSAQVPPDGTISGGTHTPSPIFVVRAGSGRPSTG